MSVEAVDQAKEVFGAVMLQDVADLGDIAKREASTMHEGLVVEVSGVLWVLDDGCGLRRR